jgi:RNA polymerase sigma-70 factor (ECF subfamily)
MNGREDFIKGTNFADNSEEQLIKELKAGKESAFNRLIEEHKNRVYRIALSLVKNPTDAEDVAQDVFIKIYTSVSSFKGNSSLATWIYKITYNMSLDFLKSKNRRIKRFKTLDDPEDAEILSLSDDSFLPEKAYENLELKKDLDAALEQLPEDQREMVTLKDVHGFSYEEIIEMTGLKEGTMKSRLNRARASLREMLQSKWNI